MTQEREAERGGVFTRRNSLYGDPSTAARSLALESRAAGAERWPPRGDSGKLSFRCAAWRNIFTAIEQARTAG